MTRVHFGLFLLSFGFFGALLQGCTTFETPSMKPVYVHPADAPVTRPVPFSKIVRFKDSLGAVSVARADAGGIDDADKADDAKLNSLIAAFDYCDREQRLAFVTTPLAYAPRAKYSHVSTYSHRFEDDPNARSFVAPFECIEQKHSVKTGLAESEDVPSSALRGAVHDLRGGVIVHQVSASSRFHENDVVVKVGAYRVESRGEMAKAVDLSPIGPISFTVARGGRLVHIAATVVDTTASTRANALKLLEALCKETVSDAPSCARHSFLSAQN